MQRSTFIPTVSLSRALLPLALAGLLASGLAHGQTQLYRYTNEDGVQVMNSRIPPRYVKNGYEIVTPSGEVLEVVAPALTEEEIAARARRKEQEERDARLRRRYTSLADIEAAKERKVNEFTASISILNGNANNIANQITDVQARAADIERNGRQVPQVIIDNLEALENELKETQRMIRLREEDREAVEARFDRDIARFKEIQGEVAADS